MAYLDDIHIYTSVNHVAYKLTQVLKDSEPHYLKKVVGRKIVLAYASRGLRKHEKTMRNGRH